MARLVHFCRSTVLRSAKRSLSTSHTPSSLPEISLRDPLPNFRATSTQSFSEDASASITTLDNGLRIASQNKLGSQCALGVIIKTGPRFEVNTISGVSHFLEKLGFHSSESYADRNAVQKAMEDCNSIFDCQISRDFIIYAVSGFNNNIERLTHCLSDTVLRARFTPEEVEMAERSISFELQALMMSPPVEPVMNELLHSAAYSGHNTLGLPRFCPEENLGKIRREDLVRFVSTYYKPDRMVIAGVGVEHDAFVKAVEKYFIPTVPNVLAENNDSSLPEPDESVAQYTGGRCVLERDLAQYHSPMPEFAYAGIGLESCAYGDAEFVPACLLQSLLGGGGSFSAGGPGKGMYTRLYLNVLNE